MTLPVKEEASDAAVTPAKLPSIVWETAVEAFVKTLLVLVLGQVAIGVVGGLWHEMAPSMPPGASIETHHAQESSSTWKTWGGSLKHQGPYVLFATFFVLMGWQRLTGGSRGEGRPERTTRTKKILKRVSEDWFGLIVGNGFGALVSAIALFWIQQFSAVQWIWHWVLGSIGPALQSAGERVLGVERYDMVRAWFGWYGDNQLKFNFWLLYMAAICDDLGIPNLKTLARWLWRRARKRKQPETKCA